MTSKKKNNDVGSQRHLVVMVKTPVAGRVKTRLSKDIGLVRATYFYRIMVQNVINRVSSDSRWKTWLAIAPDNDLHHPFWGKNLTRIPQGSGDLGKRMQNVMEVLPPGPVIIIGTDIPEITPSHIARAFHCLGDNDAVFGPCDDGGYWLVGQKRTPKVLKMFKNVHWSSVTTLSDTLANLCNQNVAQIMTLQDVDNGPEYSRLRNSASQLIID